MKLINYNNKLHDIKSANFENESDFFFICCVSIIFYSLAQTFCKNLIGSQLIKWRISYHLSINEKLPNDNNA